MTNDHFNLIAFLSVIGAIVILVIVGAILAINAKSVEALGIAGAVTGLIGVVGTFKPRSASEATTTVTNTAEETTIKTEPGK